MSEYLQYLMVQDWIGNWNLVSGGFYFAVLSIKIPPVKRVLEDVLFSY